MADGLVVSMAVDLPILRWSAGSLQTRPRLLELLMQGCGVVAYAESGRMMIPSRIDAMTWYAAGMRPVPSAGEEPVVAHVFPRSTVADRGATRLLTTA